MNHIPHVALLIETTRSYTRSMIRGVRRYVAENGPWSIYLELRALDSPEPAWLRGWRGDGILARTGSPELAEALQVVGVPVVELRSSRTAPGVPFVGTDNEAVATLVARHLMDHGFRSFGYYGIGTEAYFVRRRNCFLEILRTAGHPCALFETSDDGERPAVWEQAQDRLADWVGGLPKPVGILACTDQLGFWLLDACRRAGVRVPEDVAVVGVENEETLCTTALPPLSSVQMNGERAGYEAASLLARMMAGGFSPPAETLIEPVGLVARASSDVVAIADETLAAALHHIRDHACSGLTVNELLAAVPVSRSSLERGLRSAIGRTPAAEIRRVQLDRARLLLADTELSLAAVAEASGFVRPQTLWETFRRHFGQTPGAFRRDVQG